VYYWYEGTNVRGIYWQNKHPLFQDPRVRRALTLAINRRELLQLINVPGDIALVDGPYTLRQVRRGQLPAPLPYDPEQARALLEAAGWQDRDGDGMRERDGQAFRFNAIVFQPPYPQIALYVQDQFRRVGVHMDLQPLDDSVVQERLERGAFEAAFATVWGSRWLLQDQHSSIGYENSAVFALFQRAKDTADPDAEDRIYRELANIVRADAPVTFLCPKVDLELVHRRVQGLSSPWRAEPLEFMEHLWLEDER
ncbi:MAG: ABC transporter substrate-binding protein, partial [Candidatus Methylomirabilis sp.]